MKEPNYSETYFSLWLKEPEAVRYYELWKRFQERAPYANKSDMNRELLGLSPLRALSSEEIEYFRTGKK
jgi:hypothetical protein